MGIDILKAAQAEQGKADATADAVNRWRLGCEILIRGREPGRNAGRDCDNDAVGRVYAGALLRIARCRGFPLRPVFVTTDTQGRPAIKARPGALRAGPIGDGVLRRGVAMCRAR